MAPEILDFSCNGGAHCVVTFGEDFAMQFTFADDNGDASSWRITAVREDGRTFLVDERPITPPSGGGTITRYSTGFTCVNPPCRQVTFELRLVISDTTGRSSRTAVVGVVVTP